MQKSVLFDVESLKQSVGTKLVFRLRFHWSRNRNICVSLAHVSFRRSCDSRANS